MEHAIAIIKSPADLTIEWLSATIGTGSVASFTANRIGTGQMSECYRVQLKYNTGSKGPDSVVLKVAAADETSRQSSISLGLYQREIRFYKEVAPVIGGPISPCYHASFNDGTFCLLLGDASPAKVGNEIEGASIQHARLAISALSRIHGPVIGKTDLENIQAIRMRSGLNQKTFSQLFNTFLERYNERVKPEHRDICEKLIASFDPYLEAQRDPSIIQGLVHGDYRLDNMLFGLGDTGQPITILDWQTVSWGPAMSDVAYFLGCALKAEDRRAHSEELLRLYYSELGKNAPITFEQCREGVRQQTFFGVVMAIVSPIFAERTERGDDMFMTLLDRHCTHVLDLEALDVLPEPVITKPLRPDAADDAPQTPLVEPLWNESWYSDVADIEQGVGAYVRLGNYPNENYAWYTAVICGPGRPTIAVTDFNIPLRGKDLLVQTDTIKATHTVDKPLQLYSITLDGQGESHDDPSAILRGERGRPVKVTMDLKWTTNGEPYQYRITPRYEIPCIVKGEITVGEESISFAGAPGQRDHSWGKRDWWSMDWVWSAFHLNDGTHLHGLDLRMPNAPRMSMGYVQRPDMHIKELDKVLSDEKLDGNGLIQNCTLRIEPENLVVHAKTLGHGPLRLTAADGRIAMFPRWWAELITEDGRTGIGWLELNHNPK